MTARSTDSTRALPGESPDEPGASFLDSRGERRALLAEPSGRSRPAGLRGVLSEPGVLQRIVCAAFAWSVTVAPVAFSRVGSTQVRLAAITALVAAAAGPVLVSSRKAPGRHLGITVFLALSTLVWVLTPAALDVARLDFVRATIGAVAWAVFALSWGEPWRLREETTQDDVGGALRARAELPPFAVPLAALGVVSAVALLGIAWQVRDGSRALLAHAVAVGGSVALVSAAAEIAVGRGKPRKASAQATFPRSAARALLALAVFALVGAVGLVLRSR